MRAWRDIPALELGGPGVAELVGNDTDWFVVGTEKPGGVGGGGKSAAEPFWMRSAAAFDEVCVDTFLPDMPERGREGGIVGPAVAVADGAAAHVRLFGAMGRRE